MVREIYGKSAVCIYMFLRRLTKLQRLEKLKMSYVLAKSTLIIFLAGKDITY